MIRILLRAAGFIGAIVLLFVVIGDVLTGLAGSPSPQQEAVVSIAVEGDSRRGEEMFFDPSGPGCYKCHSVGNQGGSVGPALTDIGNVRTPQFIMESILSPDRQIASGFETVEIDTPSGERIRGVRKAEDGISVTLALSSGEIRILNKEDIRAIAPRKESTMPGNFGDLLTVNQLHDLLAYLLKQP